MNYNYKLSKKEKAGLVVGGISVGILGFLSKRYRIANASEQIVRTGLGIKNISVKKTAIQWPFQKAKTINIDPKTFRVEIDAMSDGRIPFKMPTTWTIGPELKNDSLINYAQLVSEKGEDGLHNTVRGVIQGETRILTANMNLDDIFSNRDLFRKEVQNKISTVIEPFGLIVYNANIDEMRDLDANNPYFSEQKKRALQKVTQRARVDVAQAEKDGTIGEATHKTESRQETARLEKEAQLIENERDKDIAESFAELETAKAEFDKSIAIAKADSLAAGQKKEAELQAEVEKMRIQQRIENIRAQEWSKANVNAEIEAKIAEGKANAIKIKAEAELYAKHQEAEGILAIKEAEAEGLEKLVKSAGGVDGLNKYLLVERDTLPQLAQKQANALLNLKPKISVWNTGNSDTGKFSDTITDLFKTGMPLLDGVKEQTGYDFLKSANITKENPEKK